MFARATATASIKWKSMAKYARRNSTSSSNEIYLNSMLPLVLMFFIAATLSMLTQLNISWRYDIHAMQIGVVELLQGYLDHCKCCCVHSECMTNIMFQFVRYDLFRWLGGWPVTNPSAWLATLPSIRNGTGRQTNRNYDNALCCDAVCLLLSEFMVDFQSEYLLIYTILIVQYAGIEQKHMASKWMRIFEMISHMNHIIHNSCNSYDNVDVIPQLRYGFVGERSESTWNVNYNWYCTLRVRLDDCPDATAWLKSCNFPESFTVTSTRIQTRHSLHSRVYWCDCHRKQHPSTTVDISNAFRTMSVSTKKKTPESTVNGSHLIWLNANLAAINWKPSS